MTQRSGRLTCPRCGANNFDTVTACWKCNTPLGVGGASPPPPATYAPAYPVSERPAVAPAVAMPAAATGDMGVAKRAAIALALTLPWIGLPVGWIFMMIDDHRRQTVGRLCATWSLIALFFHLLLMFVTAQAMGSLFLKLLVPMIDKMQSGGISGGSSGLDGLRSGDPSNGMRLGGERFR